MPAPHHGCRDIARLISQGQDAPLAVLERLRLSLHLLQCKGCRRFQRQSRLLREATRRWRASSERD